MDLTREQIETMEAGAEMDEIISRHVLGVEKASGCYLPFTTEMGAAWRVVEKILLTPTAGHCEFEIRGGHDKRYREKEPFGFWFYNHQGQEKSWNVQVFAATAPLAICRAALLTVLAEHDAAARLGVEVRNG